MPTEGETNMPGGARVGSTKFGHKLDLPKAERDTLIESPRSYIILQCRKAQRETAGW